MIYKTYLHGIWRLRWQLLATHAVESAVAVALITPLLAGSIRLALSLSGQNALADQDIAMYLVTPVGGLSFLLIGVFLVTAFVLEISVMMEVVAADRSGERRWGLSALRAVLARLPRLMTFSGQLILRLLALSLPFIALAGTIAWMRLTEHDINYYLSVRPPELIRTLWLIAPVLLLGGLLVANRLVAWSMALPLVLFAHSGPHGAFSESARMTKANRLPMLASFGAWALLSFGLGLGVTALAGGLSSVADVLAHGSLPRLVTVLGTVLLLWALAVVITGALSQGVLALLILQWLERLGGRPAHDPSDTPALPPPTRLTQFAAFGAFAAVTALVAGVSLARTLSTADRVVIIGHRGAAGIAPENTLAAIQAGIDGGADWVEIDVQETAEGEVIVNHDSDFMRVAGDPMKVWTATRARIEALDPGGRYGPEFAGQRIPFLAEVLELAKGKANVLIELKYYGHDDDLVHRVAELVEAAGMVDQVALMSLNAAQVRRMQKARPHWPVGLLAATALGDLTRLDVDFLAVSTGIAKPAFLRHARGNDMPVYVWTVNDPVTMSQMVSRGVAGVITDYPAVATTVLEARAGMTSIERLLLELADLFGLDIDISEGRSVAAQN